MSDTPSVALPGTLGAAKAAALSAALGLIGYTIIDAIPWFRAQGIPQGAVQFGWLLLMMAAAGLVGYLSPVRAWRWGALVLAVQPLCMLILTLVRGEPDATTATIPARTSVFIASVFIATVCPFTLLAASALASKRRQELQA
ncbi:MAG: hypothetical protein IBJ03_05805 [Gemmatimonadaceae bacterium]|nr:hypothetical protein [Gemmatimonadaceae bacterium]